MKNNTMLILQNVDRRERRGVMAALDASQCLIWFDSEGRIVDANPNVQHLLDRDLGSLTRLTHADVIGEADIAAPHYQKMWGRIRDGLQKNDERSVFNRSGSEIWCSISYAPIMNDKNQTRRVLAIVIDLSPWAWRPKDNIPPPRPTG